MHRIGRQHDRGQHIARLVLAGIAALRVQLIGQHQRQQDHPIGRIDARGALEQKARNARGLADVVPMHPTDDEAREHEEEIDARVEIAQQPARHLRAHIARIGQHQRGMIGHHHQRRQPAPHLHALPVARERTGFAFRLQVTPGQHLAHPVPHQFQPHQHVALDLWGAAPTSGRAARPHAPHG
jgi:hypothetical protein